MHQDKKTERRKEGLMHRLQPASFMQTAQQANEENVVHHTYCTEIMHRTVPVLFTPTGQE
eukprot:5881969-Amphidinium_carterae.1